MLTYHLFRFFSRLLKTVYRFSRHGRQFVACSDPQFRDVPKHGYRSDTHPLTNDIQFNKHSWMASTCPSPTRYNHLQMASLSPFPTSQCWYYTMRVQISGHSSIQLSSTFGSRKARNPIYILRFKKIEQGHLLYPKICPPIFFRVLTSIISICSSLLKELHSQPLS